MRRPRFTIDEPAPLDPLVRLWMLRILIPLGGLKGLVRDTIGNHEIFTMLGAGDPALDDADDARRYALVQPRLKELWQRAESEAAGLRAPAALRANLGRLSASLGLDDIDRQLLEWACLIGGNRLLADTADALGNLSGSAAASALARIVGLPDSSVKRALGPGGMLPRSGLLRVEHHDRVTFREKFRVINHEFVDAIQVPDVEPLDLLRGSIRRGDNPQLDLDDYPHLAGELATLQAYLEQALEQRRAGVNLLLYGPPGTGKSELARIMAQHFACELFEVASEDGEGDLMDAEERLRAYAAAQRFLAKSRSLVLFDECSDAFAEGGPGGWQGSGAKGRVGGKGWFNRVLESNPVPTLWLTNTTADMDPALLRRFDMVIEMPVPPREVRRAIAEAHCGGMAAPVTLDALAASAHLAPAVLTRAAAVARAVAERQGAADADASLLRLVNQTLRVQGHPEIRINDPARLPEAYDPRLVHADVDLAAMAAGIGRVASARLCLYGPPGTGKSAYARWLARTLGRPLHLHRASDLISMWLGQSEKNIARAFREAERDRAVLVLDEIDSFLQERRGAERSWEITQVNEMLTQMEAFAGVFVATTNFIEGLDAAALRRFDLKAGFGYLRPGQAVELLRRQCDALGLDAPAADQMASVAGLAVLTPGDFAAVARRHAFQPLQDARDLVDALIAECALKPGAKPPIGFVGLGGMR